MRRPHQSAARIPSRASRGFTLVELLVALVVFDIALLAFAADAAMLVRLHGRTLRRDQGRAAAISRLALLRAAGCPAPGAGHTYPAPGVQEFWTVESPSMSVRVLRDSVDYGTAAAPAALVLRSAVPC
jgi:prepilin-type N-terminal cleavage/methylation domain-containing protein